MRLAFFFLFVLLVPFVLSLQPTTKETSQSDVHNREGLSDKTDSFLGTGVGLESEVASGLRDRGIGSWIGDKVKGVVAAVAGKSAEVAVRIAPTLNKESVAKGTKEIVDNMNRVLTYKDADPDRLIARVVLGSYYSGLSNGVAAAVLDRAFADWKPLPGCPLKDLHGSDNEQENKAAASLIETVLSVNPDSVLLTKAVVEYNRVLQGLFNRTEKNFVNNPDCKLAFLRGPVQLAKMMVPYGASYWAKKEFKNEAIKVVAKVTGMVVESGVRENLGGGARPNKRRFGLNEVQGELSKLLEAISSKVKAGGMMVRSFYMSVIMQTPVSVVSDDLKVSLNLLQGFFLATPDTIAQVYGKAANLPLTPAIMTWQDRKISDVFGGARADIKNKTLSTFSKRMFTDPRTAGRTGGVKPALPPASDSFLAVGGGFDDEAFLGVEGRATASAPAPEFNWFTDDPRAKYQDCVLDKPSSQGFCAACWSFAATTMLDYRLCGLLKRSKLQPLANPVMVNGRAYRPGQTKLSNQICLSCTRSGDCVSGGAPSDCLDWVKNNGLVSHACQPYKSWELFKTAGDTSVANGGKLQCPAVGTCAAGGVNNMRGNIVTALQTGFVKGLDNIRTALQSGPVTLIMATPATFIGWGGKADGMPDGIFSSEGAPRVDGAHSNHIVTVFGYGQEMVGGKTRKFFLCLNSWGSLYNPFFFRGMDFNREDNNKGPWFKLDAEDPALELDKYPAYWATPGLKVGGHVVPVNGKGKDGKPYWKGAVTNTGKMVPEGKINLGNKGSGSGGNIFNPINAPNSDGY